MQLKDWTERVRLKTGIRRPIRTRRISRRSTHLQIEQLAARMSFDGSSEQFVSRLYNDLFQHPADTPGLQSWSAVLNSGGSRDQVALGMLQRSRSIKMV